MAIDYLKLYHDMIVFMTQPLKADDPLVKVRQILMPYLERLLEWEKNSVFPYAVTISPKSSPHLQNKPLKTQYNLISTFIKQTMPLYSNKYYFTFETYADNINIHTHGFVNFRTLEDIRSFKKSNRQHFNISLKPRERDCLTDVKLLGNDEDARRRWIGYCYKEMYWSVKNDIPPIYRWDDLYVSHITHPRKKKISKSIIYEPIIIDSISRHSIRPPTRPPIIEDELESEEETTKEINESTKEFLEYLRLKVKFEH